MTNPKQNHYDAVIICMYRGGANVLEISDATYESCEYVWHLLYKAFGSGLYKTDEISTLQPSLN
jgi:hypothetical protein